MDLQDVVQRRSGPAMMMLVISVACWGGLAAFPAGATAQNLSANPPTADAATESADESITETQDQAARLDPQLQAKVAQLKRLTPEHEVWIDLPQKRVLLGATVSCREGMLEMLACPAGTKEYESVLAVHSPAFLVHTGLLAIGAQPGQPVQFTPTYRAATGDAILVNVMFLKDGQVQRMPGQQMVKNLQTGAPMQHDWVFGGSGFWKNEESGQEFYHAEGGELICVSNFSTAMMDVPIESSHQNNLLSFGTFTENIPPLGTRVLVELSIKPVPK